MANNNQNAAKAAKKDEFYTQLEDINNELRHYREQFRGKSERRAVIIIMVVTAFLCNFAVENGEARLYLGKSRTISWTSQAAKPITALHSACTDFAARNKSN